MQLIIKPAKDKANYLYLTLEANEYRELWKRHARKLRASIRTITSLDFRQRTITAQVRMGTYGEAGWYHKAMALPTDPGNHGLKLMTLVHELSHRLMTGNGFTMADFGIEDRIGKDTDAIVDFQHRLIYLFEYDVMCNAHGDEGGELCRTYDELGQESNGANAEPYKRAWQWAMQLTFEQRQHCLRWLVQHIETGTLGTYLPGKPTAGDWIEQLEAIANTSTP